MGLQGLRSFLLIIIIYQQHDSSFKQEEKGIYHARDMSVVRSSIEKIPLLLVSATPSLETTYNEILKTVHPHPTLSEAIQEATADAFDEAIHL